MFCIPVLGSYFNVWNPDDVSMKTKRRYKHVKKKQGLIYTVLK